MKNPVFDRRSIRKYTSQQIEKEQLDLLVGAAMFAPSAGNQQPWQFVIVDKRDVLDELILSGPYTSALKTAQAAIIVCADMERVTREGFWIQDCSMAGHNIMLEAYNLGLGSVWIGCYPREDRMANVARTLRLPSFAIPLTIIAIGYPDETKERPDRIDPARIHYNSW
ncbi:MAG: nitroreductase family protein [Bacteroidota bacterium]